MSPQLLDYVDLPEHVKPDGSGAGVSGGHSHGTRTPLGRDTAPAKATDAGHVIVNASRYSRIQLAIALLLTACSTATSMPPPTDTPLRRTTTGSSLTELPKSTEAVTAILVAPGHTAAPTHTLIPDPPSPTTAPSPAGAAAPATSAPRATPSITITVTMNQYRFDPSTLRVLAGETIRLNLENPDSIYHAFAIPDARFSVLVRPGATQVVDFVVNLPPGSYYLVCPVQEEGNHEELGMVGVLIVEVAR